MQLSLPGERLSRPRHSLIIRPSHGATNRARRFSAAALLPYDTRSTGEIAGFELCASQRPPGPERLSTQPPHDLMSRTWNAVAPMTRKVELKPARRLTDSPILHHGTGWANINCQMFR